MATGTRNSISLKKMDRQDGGEPRDRVCDQSYIKQFNIQTVLAMLKRCQPISRTDIARMTGMSPTSITRIVTALLAQDLIYEASGEQRSGRGRKATSLRVNEDGLYSIGVHLEKSVIRLCVMNFADEVLYRGEALVDGECTPERMAMEARALLERMPEDTVADRKRIAGAGICLSGRVDPWRGQVLSSSWMNWEKVELKQIFSETLGMTAFVENDVKACLIGEKVRMNILDECDTVYMLVDQGIGMAATNGGLLVRGVSNEAGEIEDVPFGRRTGGRQKTLSDYLRQDRLIERAREFDPGIHSLEAIIWAQKQGQSWADALIGEFREYLENTVRMINCICGPQHLVIGGSVLSKLYPDIIEKMGLENLSLGSNYEESCMTGAGLIAMRGAIVERIGQNIE